MPNLPHTSPDHDELLIARLAVDDLPPTESAGRLARSWVADCPACAELLSDLKAIAAATAALPAPRRTRDFRLTEADAARLRPAGWRGLVARFGSPTFAFTRPLAAGLATLGIAGLLLATIPAGFGSASSSSGLLSPAGGNGAEAQDSSGEHATSAPAYGGGAGPAAAPPAASEAPPSAAASAAPAPVVAPSGDGRNSGSAPPVVPAPTSGVGVTTESGGSKGLASPAADTASANPTSSPAGPTAAARENTGGGPSPLVVGSLLLLIAGLGLGALRIVARRVA